MPGAHAKDNRRGARTSISLVAACCLAMLCAGRFQCADELMMVQADAKKGFHFPYLLKIPKGRQAASFRFLVVEPNNTGFVADDLAVHISAAKALCQTGTGSVAAKSLHMPLLVPVFPRPKTDWTIYTHMLDRDVMRIREGPLKRLDLQLLAMVDDAIKRLSRNGSIGKRILITGFSSSGVFANRFAMLHPDRVLAVACGGVNGLLMLPLDGLDGKELPYPLGIKDFERIPGAPFDRESWRRVRQYIYMGGDDANDAVLYDDGYSDAERKTIFAVLGRRMQPERWHTCRHIYLRAGARATFRTFAGMGHETNQAVNGEIIDFFRTAVDGR